jgi:GrpB-like predicted nucleotidyltransferase (UPF0157 family)
MRLMRLILVEGPAGTGKTATAHWLAQQLGCGEPLLETTRPHPIARDDAVPTAEFARRFHARWREWLADQAAAGAECAVVDALALQHPIRSLLRQGAEPESVLDCVRGLSDILASARTALVYLHYEPALDEQQELHDRALAAWPQPVLRVDISAKDWGAYRPSIGRFVAATGRPDPPVEIVEHDPAWAAEFEQLRGRIAGVLGPVALRIEHVGSTSVPGLAAKPILDVDVVVEDARDVREAIAGLAGLGYLHVGALGVPGREAFFTPEDSEYAHHLYVCTTDSRELDRHVFFRDRLRSDDGVAQEYARLKRELAREHRNDRLAYSEAKSAFIERVLAEGR